MDSEVVTYDRKKFVKFTWNVPNPVARLFFHHGLGEHMMRYDRIFRRFNEHNISVYGFDARGHGQTLNRFGGSTGYCGDWITIKNDIETLIGSEENINVPTFLMGHSMGALWITKYAMELPSENSICGVIISASAIDQCIPMSSLKYWSGRIFAPIFPTLAVPTGIESKWLSRIEDEVKKHDNDPLVHHKIALKTAKSLLDMGDTIRSKNEIFLAINVLISHGDADHITSYEASKAFFEKLQVSEGCVKESCWVEGGYHELHNDLCSEEVIQQYIMFILRIK